MLKPTKNNKMRFLPKIKIGKKLAIGYLIVIALFVAFFYFNNAQFKKQIITTEISDEIRQDQLSFEYTEERDVNKLSATLEAIAHDPAIKEIYLGKDRDKLYEHNQALFDDLKNKYEITHWYFILPDGHVFLRMHQRNQFDDMVNRVTFKQARDTGQIASGIELGKTAYALRVVTPYYDDNGQLIGYVELGEEIGHFLKILKRDTDNELSIMADKDFLSKDDWAATRQTAALRNNWDDLADHVVIGNTNETQSTAKCFTQEISEQVEKDKNSFESIQDGNKYFGCGGFEITDASGNHTGLVMILADVTDHVNIAININRNATKYLAGILLLTLLLSLLFSRGLVRAIKKLRDGAIKISHGALDYRVDIKTGDEIEELGNDFNIMADKLVQRTKESEEVRAGVEKQVQERTAELNKTIKDFEKMNKAMVDRELKMIELKKQIGGVE